jgi:hypothetical protein
MEQLDRQHQQHMTLAASKHAASSYRYYLPLCLVPRPMQVSYCATWHLRDASTFQKFTFEDSTPELNFPKDLIRESGATPSRCTYSIN